MKGGEGVGAFSPEDGTFLRKIPLMLGLTASAQGNVFVQGDADAGSGWISVGQGTTVASLDWLEVRSLSNGELLRRLERPA